MRSAVLAFLALASSAVAVGQQQPVVRVELTPETVAVGESTEMRVTVLVPTWFARPPVYPSFELANAITRLPPDSSYPLSERVGNETWSGIVRNYRVYPLLGATYRLAGQSITVAYANPGADPLTLDVDIPEIVFRGTVPQGAEALDPYIAGSGLRLMLQVEGDTGGLEAGDAIILRYTAELDGLPAIFLPPLAPDVEFEGVSIYADQPEVEDGTPARRGEKLTLVFEAGGEFDIPGAELAYWNTEAGAIETASAAGFAISVAGPPVTTADAGPDMTEKDWRQVSVIGLVTLITAFGLWRLLPGIAKRMKNAAERRRLSEAYAFRKLQQALLSGPPEAAYRELLAWLERLEPGMDARAFAQTFGDEPLQRAVDALSRAVFADANEKDSLRVLAAGLRAARLRYLHDSSATKITDLPSLNP